MYTNLIQLFENSVEKNPGKICIIFQGAHYSYREIQELSLRLASGLQRYPISQNEKFIIHFSNPLNYLITILALFKLGCAYIPIDNRYPKEYIKRIIANT